MNPGTPARTLAAGQLPQAVGEAPESGTVLVVLGGTLRRKSALLFASMLAAAMGAQLRVARIVPAVQHCNVLFPERCVPEVFALHRHLEAAGRRTWRWCNSRLLKPLASDQVIARAGNLPELAVRIAREVHACLIVISSRDLCSGGEVVTMAVNADLPVLVARRARLHPKSRDTDGDNRRLVAATDLTIDGVPVLRHGVRLSEALGSEITFVHNVATSPSLVFETPSQEQAAQVTGQDRLGPIAERLWGLAGQLGSDIETVVMTRGDTADAIVQVAQDRQADVVIVGRHRATWLKAGPGDGIAAVVVERARRSVLVVPIDPVSVV